MKSRLLRIWLFLITVIAAFVIPAVSALADTGPNPH
jgi:hypothetical protein